MKLTRAEFEKLALEQIDLLYRIARRLTGSADEAADLVQETFLRSLKGYGSFDLQSYGIRPWLVRVMQNLHFSRFGRDKRQRALLESLPEPKGTAASGPLPFQPAGLDGMDERLAGALGNLPEDYQTVLLLWAVEEFSYKEIADALEIPIGTVMSRLHRARQKMADSLRDFAISERVIRE